MDAIQFGQISAAGAGQGQETLSEAFTDQDTAPLDMLKDMARQLLTTFSATCERLGPSEQPSGEGRQAFSTETAVDAETLARVLKQLFASALDKQGHRNGLVSILAELERDVCVHFGIESWSLLGYGPSILATLSAAYQAGGGSDPTLTTFAKAIISSSTSFGGRARGCDIEEVLSVIHACCSRLDEGCTSDSLRVFMYRQKQRS